MEAPVECRANELRLLHHRAATGRRDPAFARWSRRNRYLPPLAVSTAGGKRGESRRIRCDNRAAENYPATYEVVVQFKHALNAAILTDSDHSKWRGQRLQRSAQPAS